MHPKRIARLVQEAASDKKGEDPVILDISKVANIAHYFVIVHGNSDTHVKALANHIADTLKKKKTPVWHSEGLESGTWVLLDFGSVIAHVFHRETREFYGLERLWGEAPRVK